ncbi:Calcium-dependent protein kinase 13 [Symbiodinium microadriaticum]|uniref:Calcium-dependent protein kinase 13 n=1 Tax=Symbiodinium microadriaticum TaxID=2951 RepID=A0A1Q9D3D6_SYMMI|nr:Calcium-dependent protein kinase 13 [Symbiodinium microadriaticum]
MNLQLLKLGTTVDGSIIYNPYMVTDASIRDERGPYGRAKDARAKQEATEERCPFCSWELQKWWPHVRVPVFNGAAEEVRLCHLKCTEEVLEGYRSEAKMTIEANFANSLRELLVRSPNLFARRAAARLSLEEERLQEAARSEGRWPFPALPPPPSATFAVEGILEMRLSASTQFAKLPSEIGFARSLDTLCLISNSLTELPPELGLLTGLTHLYLNGNFLTALPESVGALPKLQELCLDANKIERLPRMTSPKLVLLTAPGNKMKEVPLVPHMHRLEVHGNQIHTITTSLGSPVFHNLVTLKVMGNQLEHLPDEVAYMTNLRIVSVAENRLKSLPDGISSLQGLEWLLAYGNCLTELSSDVITGPSCNSGHDRKDPECVLHGCSSKDPKELGAYLRQQQINAEVPQVETPSTQDEEISGELLEACPNGDSPPPGSHGQGAHPPPVPDNFATRDQAQDHHSGPTTGQNSDGTSELQDNAECKERPRDGKEPQPDTWALLEPLPPGWQRGGEFSQGLHPSRDVFNDLPDNDNDHSNTTFPVDQQNDLNLEGSDEPEATCDKGESAVPKQLLSPEFDEDACDMCDKDVPIAPEQPPSPESDEEHDANPGVEGQAQSPACYKPGKCPSEKSYALAVAEEKVAFMLFAFTLIAGCRGLTRLLLEGNPLKPSVVSSLIEAVPRSNLKTLGLDTQQVREAAAASPSGFEELPAAVSVGTVLPVQGSSQISFKLTRASQLRRQPGVKSVAQPGGPADPVAQPAKLLIVAFAASQGEPEWLGFLRRLLEKGKVTPLPQASADLSDLLEADGAGDFDRKMSMFWTGSPCIASEDEQQEGEVQALPLPDFDVLTAVDHRMRWYAEDRPAVETVLRELRPRYSKMLCVGASMGGFAAVLHGGLIADGVLALNPQANLPEALLRPPAETPRDLQDLSESLLDSAKAAAARGAQVTVHSAADEHLLHTQSWEPSGFRNSPPLRRMTFGTSFRQKFEKQWHSLPPPLKEGAYKTVDAFLKHTGSEKSNTRVLFRKHAKGKDMDGEHVLDLAGAKALVSDLSNALNIHQNFFYDLETQFYQFDFNGDARLNQEETICMVRSILKQRRATAGGKPEDDDRMVPYKTPREAGYYVTRELGRGGQGVMYLATKSSSRGFFTCRDGDDKEYCIKFYSKKDGNAGSIHELVDEFSRMNLFRSEFVAKTYETFQDLDFYYLVNEPYFGGDWTKLAHKAHAQGIDMSEQWWRGLFRQCVSGLDYLHRCAQMHCDIKEPNLMIKSAADYSSPKVVYIDFGLSQAFAKKLQNICGTPGYIPPETWKEYVWYPQGDIFSLGVVFFQMLSGRVPSSDGNHKGIFQEGADLKAVAKLTIDSPPPWAEFPQQWRQLGGIVAAMLQKQQLSFDIELAIAQVGKSREAVCRDDLINELCEQCNLCDLRALRARLDEVASFGSGLRGASSAVPAAKFAEVVRGYGISAEVLDEYMSCVQGPLVVYNNLLQEVVKEKEKRSMQLVSELFNEMDFDGNGYLSESEIRALLQSDAFECSYEDVDEVLDNMDFNHDGYVDIEEMKRAIMEDGRIARKDEADEGAKPFWNWFGLF